ncbi:LOW QUALITY PROTEIN: hypothetical protein AAY473_032128 [Plecturocebus cupreus]
MNIYHDELKIEVKIQQAGYRNLRKNHSINFLKICGDKASADHEAMEKFIDEFPKVIDDENSTSEHI